MFLRLLTRRPASFRLLYSQQTASPTSFFTTTTANNDDEKAAAIKTDPNAHYKRPTLKDAQCMPRHVSEFSSTLLLQSALQSDPSAVRERLVREIIAVDKVSYPEANQIVNDISAANISGLSTLTMPYYTGIGVGFVMAWACLPFVFDWGTAEWFNAKYVTMEVPEIQDRETWLEVGSWTWSWNEPVMGTLMFQLLAIEFGRNQMLNVGLKPYTAWILSSRANRLAKMYPRYSAESLRHFSKTDTGLGEFSQANRY